MSKIDDTIGDAFAAAADIVTAPSRAVRGIYGLARQARENPAMATLSTLANTRIGMMGVGLAIVEPGTATALSGGFLVVANSMTLVMQLGRDADHVDRGAFPRLTARQEARQKKLAL